MAEKKQKTIKKITEIPNASVTIEVEENANEESTTEIIDTPVSEESSESAKEELKETTPLPTPISEPEVIENFDSENGFGWKKVLVTILVILPIGFLMFGGFLYFSKNLDINKIMNKEDSKKSIDVPITKPTPTKEKVDKQAYVIEVQNGSGIAGEGKNIKEKLETAGFQVSTVGNADNANYKDTIIKVSDKVSDGFIEELTKTLEERGSVGKVEKLATGTDGDVIVIVGSDLKDVKPTPTP